MHNQSSYPQPSLKLASVRFCNPGFFPWDEWERWAISQKLEKGLASEGRTLIREASQHGWEPCLQAYCGWSDDGQSLLADALRTPEETRRRWAILMRTDGFIGDHNPETGRWELDYLQPDAEDVYSYLLRRFSKCPLPEGSG